MTVQDVKGKRKRDGDSRPKPPKRRQVIAADALPWRAVPLPDRLEDAEGFFGLEEIDDVQVLRDADNGTVQFITSSDQKANIANDSPPSNAEEENATSEQFEDETSWSGIEDGLSDASDGSRVRQAALPDELRPPTKTTASGNESLRGSSKAAVHRSLGPEWQGMGIDAEVLHCIANQTSFVKPTAIQRAVIPKVLAGHDLVSKAPTGSGKTLGFGIPILCRYLVSEDSDAQKSHSTLHGSESPDHAPIALILSPTRELAHQISRHLTEISPRDGDRRPRIVSITGGLSLHKQRRLLSDADIIIATPGRLWELMSSEPGLVASLQRVAFLVLDEADRLLSNGRYEELEKILDAIEDQTEGSAVDEIQDQDDDADGTHRRQTLVFSATFEQDLQKKLASRQKPRVESPAKPEASLSYLMHRLHFREDHPQFVDVSPTTQLAPDLQEGMIECAAMEKDLYLYTTLLLYPKARSLVFANSIASVRRLTALLKELQLPVHALHSEMIQKARLRSIERFSSSATFGSILIATDVAARGLDIPSIDLVLHYHVPRSADMYIHRSGRSARAGRAGTSVVLCSPEEVIPVRRLFEKVHTQAAGPTRGRKTLPTANVDRRLVGRLKERVALAKRLSDAAGAKERTSHEGNWLKKAAEELGVDYDSEEFVAGAGSAKGRGQGRRKKTQEASAMSKEEAGTLRVQLRSLLQQRLNVGVSEKYLTAGGVDVAQLLAGDNGLFLGHVTGLQFE